VADNPEVQQVSIEGRRYVICHNPLEARKNAAVRAAIIAKLEATLQKQGQRAVVGNKGFARFMHVTKGAMTINRAAIEADARYDGTFVLRTNTELPADEVARAYKSLWRVERTFRETKSTLEVRPIFHHRDDTTIGHIVGGFLALRLEVDLQRRLEQRAIDVAWPDLMRDLEQVRAVDVTLDGPRYRLRTDLLLRDSVARRKDSGRAASSRWVAGVSPRYEVVKKSPPVAGLQIAVASRRRNSSEYLPGIPALLALLGALRPARSGDFFTISEMVGAAHHAFAAAGVRVPSAITALGPAPSSAPAAPTEAAAR
jgi:hypothetical protein